MVDEATEERERLKTIARLTAGLSHDFVNVLMLVLATAEAISHDDAISDESRACARIISSAAGHATRLADRLGALARGDAVERQQIDLRTFVTRSAELLQRVLGSGIGVTIETNGAPCEVVADPVELEQILLNLAFNARDAMAGIGELAIAVKREADRSVLTVRDTGPGMPPEVAARVFEPGFTTKPQGGGMGLAIVQRVVHDTSGRIELDTAPGTGTTIRIQWPS